MITCFIDTVICIHRIYIWLIHFPITKDMFLLYDKYQYVCQVSEKTNNLTTFPIMLCTCIYDVEEGKFANKIIL